ncbi:coiled-coil-helix-coiled-coil-helix domain-containing protein 1 [Solenopsis invicta]|uniref:coiled-coil-helix-coiled-coil-helix domain-containing protein 1 n=1 Tax=Solenopsis invicta TaxID=13686 RepID=UPI00193DE9EE|nr:coiled-coil-helix-coiled-coil-helix domain-containing protein 1 [Solenopsis invicta]
MRFTSILFRNARQPQNENKVPFKAVLPLKLRDFVSSKRQMTKEKGCLYEMSLLLTCLEENEFEDKRCIPQLNALNQCFQVYTDNMQHARTEKEQVVTVPNSKNLTHKQVTYLIRRYPTV